jgi:formate dehydrogenase accessory protein FdhD
VSAANDPPASFADHWTAEQSVPVLRGDDAQRWHVPEEAPIAMVYGDMTFAIMLATPQDLEDFACGFSISERIAQSVADIRAVSVRARAQGIDVMISLAADAMRRLEVRQGRRSLAGRSGCGICGIDSAQELFEPLPRVASSPVWIDAQAVARACAAFENAQPLKRSNRSVHGAAWIGPGGDLCAVREDVGRHNALDKLLGHRARNGLSPTDGFILISSRCSYEIVDKAARFGARALVSLSAPTAFALRRAREANLSLGCWSDNQLVRFNCAQD